MSTYVRNILIEQEIIPDSEKSQYSVKCPFHNEKNGQSLHINFTKNFFMCFSGKCQPHGIKGNLNRLLSLLGYAGYSYSAFNSTLSLLEYKHTEDKFNYALKANVEAFDLKDYTKYHKKNYKYLTDRGISKEVCEINQVTYSDYYRRIYIPFWQDGVCYGTVSRTDITPHEISLAVKHVAHKEKLDDYVQVLHDIENGDYDYYEFIKRTQFYRRYKNNYGLQKNEIVFEPLSNPNSDILVVTEGMINGLSANMFNVDANSIIGSYPTKQQIMRILRNSESKQLILAFDNDIAGQNNVNKFRELSGQLVASFNWKYTGIKKNDINELVEDEFRYLCETATYF